MSTRKKSPARKNRHRHSHHNSPFPFRSQTTNIDQNDRKPIPHPGELLEDRAVYSKSCRETLPQPLQIEAEAVSAALDLVYDGKFNDAAERLKDISRASPYSTWRLFVRGLISFYRGELTEASANWSRLEPQRRAARIAAVLWKSETDLPLPIPSLPTQTETRPDVPRSQLTDKGTAKLANLAKEMRSRTAMIALAKRIVEARSRNQSHEFSPIQAKMLVEFETRFRRYDREFANEFSIACVRATYFQPHALIFENIRKFVPGPGFDPHWNLFALNYAATFTDDNGMVQEFAKTYVEEDLPRITTIAEPVRDALASFVLAFQAKNLSEGWCNSTPSTAKKRQKWQADQDGTFALLDRAIQRYPKNRYAHDFRISAIHNLRRDFGDKDKLEAIAVRVNSARRALVEQFPDAVDVAVPLIDDYIERDCLDDAKAVIQIISSQRHESPLVKALPWKVELFRARELSQKKGTLGQAKEALDRASQLWPTWLSRDWLEFLQVAFTLRSGDTSQRQAFEQATVAKHGHLPLAYHVMLLAAAQTMSVPRAELGKIRVSVDEAWKALENYSVLEACEVGAFLWDLDRVGISFPAWRKLGRRFGTALKRIVTTDTTHDDNKTYQDACCWLVYRHYFGEGYSMTPPPFIKTRANRVPKLLYAFFRSIIGVRRSIYVWSSEESGKTLQAAAATENDPFYRYEFSRVAEHIAEAVLEVGRYARPCFSFDMFDKKDYEDDDFEDIEDDDDDEDFVDDEGGFDDDASDLLDMFMDGEEDDDVEFRTPLEFFEKTFAKVQGDRKNFEQVLTHIGPEGFTDFLCEFGEVMPRTAPENWSNALVPFMRDRGVPVPKAKQFLADFLQAMRAKMTSSEPGTLPSTAEEVGFEPPHAPKSPLPDTRTDAEKKDWEKRRHKVLNSKMGKKKKK